MKKLNKLGFSHFEGILAIIVIALIVGIGTYILGRPHAASINTIIEAESMRLPKGASIISDSTASGGRAVKLSINGTASTTFNLADSSNQVTISAHGTECNNIWPQFTLKVDNLTLIPLTFASTTTWTNYSANINLNSGTHTLSVSDTNWSKCGRYLYADVITFNSSNIMPTINLNKNPSTINNGQSTALSWSANNATNCSAPWTSSNATSGSQTVTPTSTTTYSITCNGPGGTVSASTDVTVNNNGTPALSDDFSGNSLDSTLWKPEGFSTTPVIQNSYARMQIGPGSVNTSATWSKIESLLKTYSYGDYSMTFRWNRKPTESNQEMWAGFALYAVNSSGQNDEINFGIDSACVVRCDQNTLLLDSYKAGAVTENVVNTGVNLYDGTFHTGEIVYSPTSVVFKFDGVQMSSITDTNYIPTLTMQIIPGTRVISGELASTFYMDIDKITYSPL